MKTGAHIFCLIIRVLNRILFDLLKFDPLEKQKVNVLNIVTNIVKKPTAFTLFSFSTIEIWCNGYDNVNAVAHTWKIVRELAKKKKIWKRSTFYPVDG